MMSIHMISNNVMLKLTKGQGHKVKTQGHKVKGQIQICKCVKMLWLYSINQLSYTVKGRQHVLKINDLWGKFSRLLPFFLNMDPSSFLLEVIYQDNNMFWISNERFWPEEFKYHLFFYKNNFIRTMSLRFPLN